MSEIFSMTDNELKHAYIGICESIDVFDCYGVNDLIWRSMLEKELDKRNIEIKIRTNVCFDEDNYNYDEED